MISKKTKARTFQRMKYRTVQRKNSRNRLKLSPENQQYLKDNGYRNIGWSNVITLFEKILELQKQESINNLSLEELFIEADRIGNKYLSNQEISDRHLKIAQELNEIADIIELQFPDNKIEVIDYSKA